MKDKFKELYFGLVEECFDNNPESIHINNYDYYLESGGTNIRIKQYVDEYYAKLNNF